MTKYGKTILMCLAVSLAGCAAIDEIIHWNDGPTGAEMDYRIKQCKDELRNMRVGTWEYKRQKELCKELESRR